MSKVESGSRRDENPGRVAPLHSGGQTLGDPQAFIALYDASFARVYNYVRYRVNDRETAEDLVSRVFERAFDRAETFDPARGTPDAWLMGIARNTVNMHLRAMRRRRWLSLDLLGEPAAEAPGPEHVALYNEALDELLAAVTRLSDRERHLIACKFGAEMSHREIARLTGLTANHVGVIVYRAIRRLRDVLDDRGVSHES